MPISLVEQHVHDIFFLVDIDYTYIQAIVTRVRWLRPLGYELDVDQAPATITALLVEEIDKIAKPFGTYGVVKTRVETYLKIASMVKRKDNLVRKIKKRFGADIEAAGTVAEEEDESEEEEEPRQGPIELTQGLGEDKEEGFEEEEVEEEPTQVKEKKRKAKT